MPLNVNFTTGQTLGVPTTVNLADSSTGTDVSVVSRRVTFTDKDGVEYVVTGTSTSYELWPNFPASTTTSLNVLTRDRALYVKVDWVDISGNVLYSLTKLQDYTLYAKTYYIFLCKAQSSNIKLRDSANFYQNYIKLLVSIKEADDSVTLLEDIGSSQAALNRAYDLINKPSNFF